jgi:hypothetical protein
MFKTRQSLHAYQEGNHSYQRTNNVETRTETKTTVTFQGPVILQPTYQLDQNWPLAFPWILSSWESMGNRNKGRSKRPIATPKLSTFPLEGGTDIRDTPHPADTKPPTDVNSLILAVLLICLALVIFIAGLFLRFCLALVLFIAGLFILWRAVAK